MIYALILLGLLIVWFVVVSCNKEDTKSCCESEIVVKTFSPDPVVLPKKTTKTKKNAKKTV